MNVNACGFAWIRNPLMKCILKRTFYLASFHIMKLKMCSHKKVAHAITPLHSSENELSSWCLLLNAFSFVYPIEYSRVCACIVFTFSHPVACYVKNGSGGFNTQSCCSSHSIELTGKYSCSLAIFFPSEFSNSDLSIVEKMHWNQQKQIMRKTLNVLNWMIVRALNQWTGWKTNAKF